MSKETKIWQTIRENNRYFVNKNFLKYGVSDDKTDFEKRNKGFWVWVPALLFFLVDAGVVMFSHSIIFGIPCILASIALYVFILRKFVFDEKQFKRLLADNNTNNEVSISGPLNNLLSIDNTGQWFYQKDKKGLRSAFLVTFDYASLLDLSLTSTRTSVEDAIVPFIKELHDNRFSFSKYDISVGKKISLGTLKEIQQTKTLEQGSWLRLVEQLQNETLSSLEQNSSNTYKIFFLISNHDFNKLSSFKRTLQTAIDSTLVTQNSIVNPRVCDMEESLNFIVNYYQISSFDPYNIKRNVQHMDVSRYFDFIGFFDNNNVKYKLEDFIDNSFNHSEFDGSEKLDENKISRLTKITEHEEEKKANAEEVKKLRDRDNRRAVLDAYNRNAEKNKVKVGASSGTKKPRREVGVFRNQNDNQTRLLNKRDAERKQLQDQKEKALENRKRKLETNKTLGNAQGLTLNDLLKKKK